MVENKLIILKTICSTLLLAHYAVVIKAYTTTYIYVYCSILYYLYSTCNLNFYMGRELNPGHCPTPSYTTKLIWPNFISVFIHIVNICVCLPLFLLLTEKRGLKTMAAGRF